MSGKNAEGFLEVEVFAIFFELEGGGDFFGEVFVFGELVELALASEFGEALESGVIDNGIDGFVDAFALALDGFAGFANGIFVLRFCSGFHFFLGGADFSGELFLLEGDFDTAGLKLLRREAVEGAVKPFDAADGDLSFDFGFDAGLVGAGLVERDHAVPDLLGAHAAQQRAGEVIDFTEFHILGIGNTLVGLGIEDGAQDGLHVIVGGLQGVFEEGHELRIARHGAVGDIIDGFDEALAHELFPQTVGDNGGEARVVLAGHPGGVGVDGLGAVFNDLAIFTEGDGDKRLDLLLGFGVGVLIIVREKEGFLVRLVEHGIVAQRAEDLAHGAADVFALDSFGQVEFGHGTAVAVVFILGGTTTVHGLRKQGIGKAVAGGHAIGVRSHLVVVHLRPFIERMVVTLGADHAGAEKDLGGHRHVIERHVVIADVEADGAVLVGFAVRRDGFTHQLIVGLVVTQALLEPPGVGIESRHALTAADHVALEAQDVGPVVVEVLHVAFTGEESVDQLAALVRFAALEKFGGLLDGRNAADDIEIDTADKDFIACGGIGLNFLLREFRVHEIVDLRGGGLKIRGGSGQGEAA